ncbi:MAG: Dabb family protein [bacterium]
MMAYAADNAKDEQSGVLRHVVCFKFKDDAPQEQVDQVVQAFADLKNKIPQIVDFEWGTNNSPENLNQDFTHCFLLTFKSEEDRDAYLPHPDHKAFGRQLGPVLDKVFVIDYWAKSN